MVYEAAILWAQAFLMTGIYFTYRAFELETPSRGLLATASVFWVAAIATRTISLFPVFFLLVLVLFRIFRINNYSINSLIWKSLLALGIPMAIGTLGLAAYNYARFESIFDFGFEYQLTVYDNKQYEGVMFSDQYVAANIYNYIFKSPEKADTFPYFKAAQGSEDEAFGQSIPDLYYAERVTGLIYVFPFLVFAFIPVTQRIKAQNHHLLKWIRTLLSGSTLIAMSSLFVFIYSTMRYMNDFTPSLTLLAIIGFWSGYEATSSDKFVQFAYSIIGIILAIVSIAVPNLLALLGADGIRYLSPQVLPALDLFYKSIFGR